MKTAIRFFALFVAIAGLASASVSPASSGSRLRTIRWPPLIRVRSSLFQGHFPANQSTPALRRPRRPSRDHEGAARWKTAMGALCSTKVPRARYPFVFETLGILALS